ncbi:hypothetical protein BDL97_16G076400 [Sphagnum fallax]|nr:hypothetical protein BDL97_16G076400 [Sphagnum fallax]
MGQALSSCGGNMDGAGIQRLFSAIREHDVQSVETLATEEPKLVNDSVFYIRTTPLHLAASLGQLEILMLLLKHGARVNAVNSRKQTPLMLACKNGRSACIGPLLDNDANVLAVDRANGRTCLHYAAKGGHIECVCKILTAAETGPVANSWGFVRYLNMRDVYGATALHLAALGGHTSVVKRLLECGAMVLATTATNGHSPYGIALQHKNIACAALLNPNSPEPLVWPSSWKFIIELEPQAKILLKTALAHANDEWERQLTLDSMPINSSAVVPSSEPTGLAGNSSLNLEESQLERSSSVAQEVCCICFEEQCTLEVQECGHQMCAKCTLSLCCHNKPNPSVCVSPPPVCPFCRQNINQIVLAKPKSSPSMSKHCLSRKISSRDLVDRSSSKKLLGKDFVGAASFRKTSAASGGKDSGRIADVDWLNRLDSNCWQQSGIELISG